MNTFIKIPFPTALDGTLINTETVKCVIKEDNTNTSIHFVDGTKLQTTNTSDATNNTLRAYNLALDTANNVKSTPEGVFDVTLPTGISISAIVMKAGI